MSFLEQWGQWSLAQVLGGRPCAADWRAHSTSLRCICSPHCARHLPRYSQQIPCHASVPLVGSRRRKARPKPLPVKCAPLGLSEHQRKMKLQRARSARLGRSRTPSVWRACPALKPESTVLQASTSQDLASGAKRARRIRTLHPQTPACAERGILSSSRPRGASRWDRHEVQVEVCRLLAARGSPMRPS